MRRFWQPNAHTKSFAPRSASAGTRAIVERAHAVVDQVQIDGAAAVERGFGEADGGVEIDGALGAGGEHEPELFPGEVHRGRA